jgi:hypothetical protein
MARGSSGDVVHDKRPKLNRLQPPGPLFVSVKNTDQTSARATGGHGSLETILPGRWSGMRAASWRIGCAGGGVSTGLGLEGWHNQESWGTVGRDELWSRQMGSSWDLIWEPQDAQSLGFIWGSCTFIGAWTFPGKQKWIYVLRWKWDGRRRIGPAICLPSAYDIYKVFTILFTLILGLMSKVSTWL